ncbi:MAG: sodium-translocating pyrophosphatase [Candidatus Terrybacteria bacterium RIFCSPLOWO2_01_FULL_40_23]|uniref:K(+)-insensitive pyrophosphate-energized proton pump n=1 Tax=Candidatus Terrybacteria bacterium RIFCSPLOWO2_01_FULL_40_23 TaxID=1802366 RepID=A0A1G2PW76_9BACT|nr:MAG: sodium-translocating pyrophosphatase [Candidatus Terrybacteria bacterium RIFCSPLOWO2_01_FULL_40_23]
MSITFILFSAFIILAWAALLIKWVLNQPRGNDKMNEISAAISQGSNAFLIRQYKTIAVVAVPVTLILAVAFGIYVALGFVIGAVVSAVAGVVGMLISVRANVRVAKAAESGLAHAMRVAFRGGAVTGFFVVGLGLLAVTSFWVVVRISDPNDIFPLVALGFGASLISVFARLGGGIYTKGADVGADLVGKIEAGIPEDDPRNPAVIADNVGDNVGDCAGMAADLFETYVVTIVAAFILANSFFSGDVNAFFFILGLAAVAALATPIGMLLQGTVKEAKGIMNALYRSLGITALLSATGFYFVVNSLTIDGGPSPMALWVAALVGLAVTGAMVLVTDYYTSKKFRPVQSIAKASETGHATNIISGLAIGMESTAAPIIVVVAGMLIAYSVTGSIFGIAVAAVAMLSLAGIVVAIDAFGPITDNAGGIAEMAELPSSVREVTDALDAVGNTTKAVTKGYAIASAALAALVLFAGFREEINALSGNTIVFEITNVKVIAGLFLGAMVPYLFAALAMRSVGKAAGAVVEEVRRQFKEKPGIMEGTDKPDYARAVDIVTKAALREMILPTLLPVGVPILIAYILGIEALGGALMGVIATGVFVALSMTAGGAAWDNAKKYIEEGNYGGKGSLAHKAAVTGDTVGDPYKDTAGPAINPVIKVMNIIAVLLVRLVV